MALPNDRDYVIRLEHENAELRARLAQPAQGEWETSPLSPIAEQLRQALDYFPGVIVLYDANRRIRFANTLAGTVAGVAVDQLIGRRDEEFLPREVTDLYLHCFDRALETRSEQSHEFAITLPSGTFKARLTYVPLLDQTGAIYQVLALAQDISKQVNAERRVGELEERFAKAFQAGPVPSVISHLDDGVVADVNNSFVALLGYTREEVIGHSAVDKGIWVNPEDRAHVVDELRSGRPVRGIRVALRTKSGQVKQFLMCAEKIEIGRTECLITHLEDISVHILAQRALREKEEAFRALAEYTPDIVVRLDREGRIVYVNNAATRVTGIRADWFIGKTFEEARVPKWLRPVWREHAQRVVETAHPSVIEFRYPTRHGRRYYEAQIVPEFDAEGSVSHVLTVSRDITERIEMHQKLEERVRERTEALARSEERFRQIFDSNMISIAFMDLRGRILNANGAFLELTGFTHEDIELDRVWWEELTPPEWSSQTRQAVKYLVTAGHVTPFEQEFIRKDGTRVAVLVGGASMQRDRKERVAFVLDISARKSGEEEIKQLYHDLEERACQVEAERARWQAVVKGIADEVWLCDTEGKMSLLNEPAVSTGGLEESEGHIQGQAYQNVDILHMDGRPRPPDQDPLLRSLRGEIVRGEEIMRHRLTGDSRYRQFSSAPLRDAEGNITGSVAIVRDITEHKATEESLLEALGRIRQLNVDLEHWTTELEAANRELESFSYSVSHDLRTPATAIRNFSQMVLDECGGGLTKEAKLYLQTIHANACHMDELIQALLQFSRAARQPLRKERISMHELVQLSLKELAQEPQDRQVEIILGELPEAQGDPLLLKQVLTNLLSNALKYTRRRERPRIVVNSYMKDGQRVYYVKDNGVGFDMNKADKLFGVFQRFHDEDEYEGTGVGLALVERIIRRHEGSICAKAAENCGATFFFTLG